MVDREGAPGPPQALNAECRKYAELLGIRFYGRRSGWKLAPGPHVL